MLTIRLDSTESLVDQIVGGIRSAIAAEELAHEAELPSVRQLASDLGVHLNTVARAYRELQQQGLVHTARGRGTRVASTREAATTVGEEPEERLARQAQTLAANAKLAGLSKGTIERLWRDACAPMWTPRKGGSPC